MLKRLFLLLVTLMLLSSSALAADKNDKEIAKTSFDSIVKGIVTEIQQSYDKEDSAILKTKFGWKKYKYTKFKYAAKVKETGLVNTPYKGFLEMSFDIQELNEENYYGYYKTKDAANISPVKPNQWSPIFDNYYFHLFTYEYQNGKWTLVRSQATTNLGDSTILGDEEHYDVYTDIGKDAVYNPLDIYLIKNYAKSPHQWVKYIGRNY